MLGSPGSLLNEMMSTISFVFVSFFRIHPVTLCLHDSVQRYAICIWNRSVQSENEDWLYAQAIISQPCSWLPEAVQRMTSQDSNWMARFWGSSGQAVASWVAVSRPILETFGSWARYFITVRHNHSICTDSVRDNASVRTAAIHNSSTMGE